MRKPVIITFLALMPFFLLAQIPKPEDTFGFKVGADYKLADYTQMQEYYNPYLAQKVDDRYAMDYENDVLGLKRIPIVFEAVGHNRTET